MTITAKQLEQMLVESFEKIDEEVFSEDEDGRMMVYDGNFCVKELAAELAKKLNEQSKDEFIITGPAPIFGENSRDFAKRFAEYVKSSNKPDNEG